MHTYVQTSPSVTMDSAETLANSVSQQHDLAMDQCYALGEQLQAILGNCAHELLHRSLRSQLASVGHSPPRLLEVSIY